MDILFLDDRKKRHDDFVTAINTRIPEWVKARITHVDTACECIIAIAKIDYDIVFLDHDLNDETLVDDRKMPFNNGMTVVQFLCSGGFLIRKVIVHSDAPEARKMVDLLRAAGYDAHRCAFGEYKWLEHLR